MESEAKETATLELAEERLRLEREALAVERERLATARAHAAEAARLAADERRHPGLVIALVILLVLLSFAGGLMTGVSVMEGRQEQQRSVRLAHALAKLGANVATTNSVPEVSDKSRNGAHRDVQVVVIQ